MPKLIPSLPPPEQPMSAPIKGRGTAWAIEHRFTRLSHECFDDGWGQLDQSVTEERVAPQTQFMEEKVKSILAANDSPDIPFDLSINPYRGCEHGCIYCFARPTHSYLNLSPGLDFETKIVAKVNAAERLREEFSKRGYKPRYLNIGSATDAYQPVERRLGITRKVIEVMAEYRHPFSVITKSSGVERDIDLIAPMAADRLAAIYVSITTLDPALARILEPRAAAPHRRLRTVETLTRAGIPVGVSCAPLIPFINEPEIEKLVQAAADAGANSVFYVVLRLPWEVSPLFQRWLEEHYPQRAARVMARVREMRGGKDYDAQFGTRMKGEGVWAQFVNERFNKAAARSGLNRTRNTLDLTQFTPPRPREQAGQGQLF
jgi:DNA repair photolyase